MLCDHPTFCSLEGDVLNSADSDIFSCTHTSASESVDAIIVNRSFGHSSVCDVSGNLNASGQLETYDRHCDMSRLSTCAQITESHVYSRCLFLYLTETFKQAKLNSFTFVFTDS